MNEILRSASERSQEPNTAQQSASVGGADSISEVRSTSCSVVLVGVDPEDRLDLVPDRFASETGDSLTARKGKHREITAAEHRWLEAAVIKLILRSGAVAADPAAKRPQITMGDLPRLIP
jgi:hypothetical protein